MLQCAKLCFPHLLFIIYSTFLKKVTVLYACLLLFSEKRIALKLLNHIEKCKTWRSSYHSVWKLCCHVFGICSTAIWNFNLKESDIKKDGVPPVLRWGTPRPGSEMGVPPPSWIWDGVTPPVKMWTDRQTEILPSSILWMRVVINVKHCVAIGE